MEERHIIFNHLQVTIRLAERINGNATMIFVFVNRGDVTVPVIVLTAQMNWTAVSESYLKHPDRDYCDSLGLVCSPLSQWPF